MPHPQPQYIVKLQYKPSIVKTRSVTLSYRSSRKRGAPSPVTPDHSSHSLSSESINHDGDSSDIDKGDDNTFLRTHTVPEESLTPESIHRTSELALPTEVKILQELEFKAPVLTTAPANLEWKPDAAFTDLDAAQYPYSSYFVPPRIDAAVLIPKEYAQNHPTRALQAMRENSQYGESTTWAKGFDSVMDLVVSYHDVWRVLQARKKMLVREQRKTLSSRNQTGPDRKRGSMSNQ
ncbi:hypothetical protein BABINDRAFT_162646 [Babjeviella inositovora NRRL Y-12698]|uniref:Uncharacterized protein n=1 Tax=Babjeviella inositovora NRRL Y-12698 TaxID=984486 RepID=A0A1E3QN48_9ASCO|nr:uncharacterized protein BABINDRAFT_162646 [Babjeviella inositovora NRRL Y-12698]ODQ78417.1 hypothetical protein BABINDRAFT_162646 [Babjeviella inositovora NRRL Y-12698]